jgi:hypothetical protein
METNEIMVNDEVIETTEEIAKTSSGKGFKMVAGIGLAVVVGVLTYKYVAKPIWAKFKAKKESQIIDTDFDDVECDACSIKDETEENED